MLTKSADCVLILMFDPMKMAIANIHASWRGTYGEIVKSAVTKMTKIYGSKPNNIFAVISPAIGKCCYEVRDDVASLFRKLLPGTNKFLIYNNRRMFLDLPNINKHQLLGCGIDAKNIEVADLCTKCNEKFFYSYRRDGGSAGRFAGTILLR